MTICPKCQTSMPDNARFCAVCGANLDAVQPAQEMPVYQQPVYQQPVYQQPVYQQPTYAQPTQATPASGKTKAGMILAIIGFAVAMLAGLLFLAALAEEDVDMMAGALFFSFIGLPLSIVGRVLSNSRLATTQTKVGRIFGTFGVVFSAVGLGMSLLCMAAI